jgi:UTP--glucose-1-phosphate uridylyltransferase
VSKKAQIVRDEARQAGIEHFIFVTGRNKGVIEDHFDRQFELELTLTERSRGAELELLSRDLPGAGQTSFTRQQVSLGLGHAVWCAREIVGREPFALLLPDVLVQARRGCMEQMIDACRRLPDGANVVAVEEAFSEQPTCSQVRGGAGRCPWSRWPLSGRRASPKRARPPRASACQRQRRCHIRHS